MNRLFILISLFVFSVTAYADSFTATWEHENPDNVEYYNNQYQIDSESFVPDKDGWSFLGATEETTRTFETIVPSDATKVSFRVRACNTNGCSNWVEASVSVNVAVASAPAPPINVVLQ